MERTVVNLVPLIIPVKTTLVFCVKHSPPDGSPKFKTCLCAQGFSQTCVKNLSKMFATTGVRLKSGQRTFC